MLSELSAKTRADLSRIIERFLSNKSDGEKTYDKMETRYMRVRCVDMNETPAVANTMIKTMKQVFANAMDYHGPKENPCAGIKPLKEGPGCHTWTTEEVEQYRAYHTIGTKACLAMELALGYSQRIPDVHRLDPQFVTSEGTLKFL